MIAPTAWMDALDEAGRLADERIAIEHPGAALADVRSDVRCYARHLMTLGMACCSPTDADKLRAATLERDDQRRRLNAARARLAASVAAEVRAA